MEVMAVNPIFIAGPPRTGTTLLAGLLSIHDFWIGKTRATKYPGTNTPNFGSENIDIKNIMKKLAKEIYYKNWTTPLPTGNEFDHQKISLLLKSIVPRETPWLIKTSWLLTFYKIWINIYPQAKWIFPIRSISGILDSMNRHPSMKKHPDKMKTDFIEALYNRKNTVKRIIPDNNFLQISPFKIATKDEKELTKLFKFVDIDKIRWSEVLEWIKPEMFHKM